MKFGLLLIFLFGLLSIGLPAQPSGDIEKIKSKLYKIAIERVFREAYTIPQGVTGMIKNMDAAGKWPDINYRDKTASKWLPSEHWQRLLELSIRYRDEKSGWSGNIEIRDAILKGIRWWLTETPMASNYWWNAIGIPGYMGGVFILMDKELDDSLRVNGVRLMKIGVKSTHYEYYGKATGQNLLWLASAHLYASCITYDMEGLKRVFASVADEIFITEGEGIQNDYSFYQHGQQNYAWGYGKGFSATAVQYFYLADQTAFQFPKEKFDIISHFLVDGQQWMSRYGYLEYSAMGREIAREQIDRGPILTALLWMIEIDPARRDDYLAFHRRLSDSRAESPLVGNRYFWRSDLMIHQRKNYYFSLKTTSNRILSGESGNGENIKGFYQGNGTYYLVRKGNEYQQILPVFNWRKLPGSLIEQTSGILPLFTWGEGSRGATSFVYGISDSLYGCFGYDYNKDGVKAHRSWFFFDNEIVCLANSINGDSLFQSINQCLLNGNVWMNSEAQKRKVTNGEKMVFHDSVGYCINNNNYSLDLKTGNQTGSWKEINLAASDSLISKKVFSLGINLGAKVVDASFSYTILPGISLEQFKKYTSKNHLLIIQNDNTVQAVYQKDIEQVQAVFFSMGKIGLPWNKLAMQKKKPGLVLLKIKGNKLVIDYCETFPKKHIELILDNTTKFENDEIRIGGS